MRLRRQAGSVVLVALSCVTVLGIAMVGFLAVSRQAMKLSSLGYGRSVSRQLAEMGLERALRGFNGGSFASWTLVDADTATLSFSISTDHYGTSGITGDVNVRVEHYLDTKKATPWNVLTAYVVGDYVWYQGVWYLCTAATSAPPAGQTPANTSYWKAAPESWNAFSNYRIGNYVFSGGAAYRCIADNINVVPPSASYWTAASVSAWSASTAYNVDNLVFSGGLGYRCLQAHTNQRPPNSAYWLSAPVIYSEGVANIPDADGNTVKIQLRATVAPAALFPNAIGSTTLSNLASSGTVDSYNSVLGAYNQTTAPFTAAAPNRGSSAVVAGGNTAGNAVAITSVRVNGYVAAPSSTTAPYAPQWSFVSGSAIVTSTLAPTIPATRVDLTRVSRSPHIPQFDIKNVSAINFLSLPSGVTSLPRGGDSVSADGKYYYYTSGDLFLTSGDTLNINKAIVIDIRPISTADLYIQGTGKIIIANNAEASLEVHFGDELYIGSNSGGGIQNLTTDPKRCIILGTSTYNSSGFHYFWSNIPFYGVIYMPNAYLHVWNSGYTEHIYGALSAKNVYFNHPANLHYDTSLRTAVISGVDAPYEISEWRELSDINERITLP